MIKPRCSIFLLFCLFSTFIITSGQDKGFLATFPTSVIPGDVAQFCIRFYNITEDVIVNINNEDSEFFDPIHETIPSTKETCFEIKIKNEKSDDPQKINVSGETIDKNYKFENSKRFLVKKVSSLTFIETDKPVYKPGQKLQLRILTIDYELNPVDKVYQEVFIQDASNTRVFQWLNVQNNAGLVSLEFPISEDPKLGIWKISVNENLKQDKPISTASFEIKKYVLPKFELKLETPSYVLINEKSLNFLACAKYSYGKDVKGELSVKLFFRNSWQINNIVALNHTEKLKGCKNISLDLVKSGLSTSEMHYIDTEASFIEDETDLTAESKNRISILYKQYELELKSSKYYKPGLPAKIRIQIKTPDAKPVNNKDLKIKILQGSQTLHEQNYLSNDEGFIAIYFTAPACNDTELCKRLSQLYIRVEVDEDIVKTRLISSATGFSVQPWYSKTSTYLQIYGPDNLKPTDCNEKIDLDIKIKSKEKLNGKVHFQVQSRSSVLYSGSYNLETHELTANINENILSINSRSIRKERKIKASDAIIAFDICHFDMSEGEGEANETKWYYSQSLGKCVEFNYNGRDGNPNNFANENLCMDTCSKRISSDKKINFESSSESLVQDESIASISVSILIDEKMSPEFSILAFYVVNGEVIPDSISIPVKTCLKNKVNLELSEKVIKPRDNVKIKISGAPNSICAISAIDKSVLFMGSRNSIDLENIFLKLSIFNFENDYVNSYPETETCHNYKSSLSNLRSRKSLFLGPSGYGRIPYDAVESFRSSGLIHFTDLSVNKQRSCLIGRVANFMPFSSGSAPVEQSRRKSQNKIAINSIKPNSESESFTVALDESGPNEIIRDFFPETWLWGIETLNQNGFTELTKESPDSITDWIFNAFCLSKKLSIGVAPTTSLKVFRPLFLSINMPYSVVKGELFSVQVSVFNYLDKCTPVLIKFSSESRIALVSSASSVKKCVCPDDKISHFYPVRAVEFDTQLGVNVTVQVSIIRDQNICPSNIDQLKYIQYSDTEVRSVLVEPEGIKNEIVKSKFVYLNGSSNSFDSFEIKLPQYVVPRTLRGFLTVIGDPMGPALNNLDNLVQLPTGCGEQNMIRFAPLVSVIKYLKTTMQLNAKIIKLAEEYLKIGYSRQLSYSHPDGSYSAFGTSDKLGGGTWLTAFVLRCYAQSFGLDQIKIDQKDVDSSFKWLLSTQNSDGSFENVGTPLLSKGLSGGMNGGKSIGLTAYVFITILTTIKSTKIQVEFDKNVIQKGLNFLQKATDDINRTNTYDLALTLYAFKLSGEFKDTVNKIEQELDKRAIIDGDLKYWREKDENKEKESNGYYAPQSADIELTSYILLAKLEYHSKTDAALMIPIVKWINTQRNSLGGFYSTQDTVVALDALSKFASVYYSKRISLRISHSVNGAAKSTLSIGPTNRLLLQSLKLNPLYENQTNSFNVGINGSGSGLVQFTLKYNIKREVKKSRSFDLKITSANKGNCKSAILDVKTKFNGEDELEQSSMAIIHFRLPSGWVPIEESIINLRQDANAKLKRHEINENKISLYFDEISKLGKSFKFEIVKAFDVKNIKPGVASVYDYYESQDNSINQEFILPC